MANLQKHRAHESLNTESAAVWDQQTKVTVGSSPTNIDVTNYHTIHFLTTEDMFFEFSTGTTMDTTNGLYLQGGQTIYSLRIPHGLGSKGQTIYFNAQRFVTTDTEIRYVLS